MSAIEQPGPGGPEIRRATAEDHAMLREVFAALLQRAASNGGSLTRRHIERLRTEFTTIERQRFERYSDAHNAIIAALRGEPRDGFGDGALFEHLVELYAGDVIEELYPDLSGEGGETWRQIVVEEVGRLIRDWLVPDISDRLDRARRRILAERGRAFRGDDLLADYDVIAVFREVNRRLDEELRDGAEFGKVLCLAINDGVRHATGPDATRAMFIGIREAETILDNVVAAQYGNRFRMKVVEPG